MKNDRWYESWFGAPPPANPARDTNGLDRWKSIDQGRWDDSSAPSAVMPATIVSSDALE